MKNYIDFEELSDLISHGSIEALESFSSRVNFYKVRIGEYGLSPLHLAVLHNRSDICKFLVEKGVDPDLCEKFSGKTPLHFAAHLGNVEAAKTLMENGAEGLLSKKSMDYLSCHPIHYAAMSGNKNMIDLFLNVPNLRKKARVCSVASQSYFGNILDILIRKKNHELLDYYSPVGGINAIETNPRLYSDLYIGYKHEYQWTSFHFAAVLGDLQSLEILLKQFPNPTCLQEEYSKHYFFSPGEIAIAEGHIQVAELLNCFLDVSSYREAQKVYSLRKGEPEYMIQLANAIIDRDETTLNDILGKYGIEILSKKSFKTDDSQYMEKWKFNAFSIACRSFAFSFFSQLEEKGCSIHEREFTHLGGRDIVEVPFFNWALMKTHPLGEAFFEKVERSICPSLGP